MKKGFFYVCERALVASSLTIAAVTLMGVKSCDLTKDYVFAPQAKVATSATATATPEDGDGVVTRTPTPDPDATETPEPTETSDPDATETPEATETPDGTPDPVETAGIEVSNIFTELKALDSPEWKDTPQPIKTLGATSAVTRANTGALTENWLGNLDDQRDQGAQDTSMDSDRDGFTDELENRAGTSARDASDYPQSVTKTNLVAAKRGSDDDLDGLSNADEATHGTRVSRSDTDRDGILDGNEVLSGSLPTDGDSAPLDADGDGLSDEVEAKLGLNAGSEDTDNDALPDGVEVALGSNPFAIDSDGDGILDGKEFQLGSHPLVSDR